jgi:hypothetical protein
LDPTHQAKSRVNLRGSILLPRYGFSTPPGTVMTRHLAFGLRYLPPSFRVICHSMLRLTWEFLTVSAPWVPTWMRNLDTLASRRSLPLYPPLRS